MKPWIVVGGGFQGIVASALLLRRGKKVILIEKAPFLGAVLSSPEQEGLFLDNGCHVFSNQDAVMTELCMEIMQDRVHIMDVRYASVTEGHRVEELAVADFTHLPPLERARILLEIASAPGTTNEDNLGAVLHSRYGATLARRLATGVKKMCLRGPEQLAANTLSKTPFGRVSMTGSGFGSLLKSFGSFDTALAVTSQRDPMRFYPEAARARSFRHFYPGEKGMKGFCIDAEAYLRKGGADIRLGRALAAISEEKDGIACRTDDGQNIEAEGMVWAMDPGALAKIVWGNDPMQDFAARVPMILYYYLIPADAEVPYSYIHDFSANTHAIRVSSPGFYGRQKNAAGLSYLCAEVPTVMDSELWQAPEQATDAVWRQMLDLKMTSLDKPTSVIVRKTPMSYPLNLAGHAAALAEVSARIERAFPRVTLADPTMFGKVAITRSISARLDGVAA